MTHSTAASVLIRTGVVRNWASAASGVPMALLQSCAGPVHYLASPSCILHGLPGKTPLRESPTAAAGVDELLVAQRLMPSLMTWHVHCFREERLHRLTMRKAEE